MGRKVRQHAQVPPLDRSRARLSGPDIRPGLRGRWVGGKRPDTCRCGKRPYQDEETALFVARTREMGDDGLHLRVYKCPGTAVWHLASRGFRPEALKSAARMVAWHVDHGNSLARESIFAGMHLDSRYGYDTRQKKKIRRVLKAFSDLGLVRLDDPAPGWVTAADRKGLLRVMMTGLEEYAGERGYAGRIS